MIKARELSIGYQTKVIARDVNLIARQGEMICLLGQNGVGKSTLMRTLSNMQPRLSGRVRLDEEPMESISKKMLARKIGIVTTRRVGASNMTVREMVALGRYPYTNWFGKENDSDRKSIDQAISICEIDYIKSSKLGEISDGQYQKTMIARAIAQDTDFILLDEPTAHLDIVNRKSVFSLLNQIKSNNKGVIVSTHELDLALQFSDRLWLMDFNTPIVEGNTRDLVKTGEIDKIFHFDG